MNIPMLQAFIDGYQERLFDLQCLAVHQGYWAGYYQSRKPKSANSVIERMIRDHKKEARGHGPRVEKPKPEVDLDRIRRLDAKRAAFLAKKKGQQRK